MEHSYFHPLPGSFEFKSMEKVAEEIIEEITEHKTYMSLSLTYATSEGKSFMVRYKVLIAHVENLHVSWSDGFFARN